MIILSLPILLLLGIAAYMDFKGGIVPNEIPALILAYSMLINVIHPEILLTNLIITLASFISLYIFYIIVNNHFGDSAFGGGDVKILSSLALYYGNNIIPIIFFSAILAFFYGLVKGIKNKTYLKTPVRFVPFIFISTLICSSLLRR